MFLENVLMLTAFVSVASSLVVIVLCLRKDS